ncbi:MAG: S41 family peptidase [Bacteroides sp.]|nr:S41 family peptidase [Bacteroides sp.]MCM1379975.1 S41 family peptidase [Bacteroides sp.]MCM1446270.1 S41 family peptidase [Prevotella sp.]
MRRILSLLIISLALTSCHPIEEYDNTRTGTFKALWSAVDEHYCFFAEKDVDWDEVYDKYSPLITDKISATQLFGVCSDMLAELRDGHTNLSSGFETSYYRNWWSDYPQNYDSRLIQQYYLGFEYKQLGNVTYGKLRQNVAYVGIPSFSSGLGNSNIDWLLYQLNTCNGLILDLRNNGGGSMDYAETWVRHFILEEQTVGYMAHKTGPDHEAFDDPYPIKFEPLTADNYVWIKPVVLLTNRSTFSAANYVVMCMKSLPNVVHAGAATGGGSGMPLTLELPNGWSVRMSAVRIYDADMNLTEGGIEPDEGCAIDLDPQQALAGIDTMLELAIKLINE